MRKHITGAIAGAAFALTAGIAGQVAHADHRKPDPKEHDVCRYEDGSGQRVCIWPAEFVGNDEGVSFIAIHGGTDRARYVRISSAKAYRLTH